MLKIRNAKIEDFEDINEVFYKTWLLTYPNKELGILKEDVVEFMKDRNSIERFKLFSENLNNTSNNSKFYVAEFEGKVVGVCRIYNRENFGQLQAIYVLPEFQNKGIGKEFWKKSLEFFVKNKKIIVQVATYNNQAIKFYESLGFKDNSKRFTEERHRMPISKVLIPEMEMEILN